MFVNLSFDSEFVLKHLEKYPDNSVIDFTGVLGLSNPKVQQARIIDEKGEIEEQAFDKYIKFVGKTSNTKTKKGKSIRDIKINGFPVFWVTGFAEKHDSYHWGQTTFYFLELLKQNPSLFKEHVTIVSNSAGYIAESCKEFLKKELSYLLVTHEFITNKAAKRSRSFVIGWFIYTIKNAFKVLKFSRNENEKQNFKVPSDIFLTPLSLWNVKLQENRILNWKKKSIKKSRYLPIVWSPLNINTFYESFSSVDARILYNQFLSQPSFFDFILLQLKILVKFFKLKFSTLDDYLKYELITALNNFSFWYIHVTLTSFVYKIEKPTTFYYSDEFYKTGRLISDALSKNKNVKSVGIQHGLIMKNHSVYHISQEELMGDNALPSPDQFIIWEPLFKRYLLKYNNGLSTEIVDAKLGNYRDRIDKYNLLKSKVHFVAKKTILWCTTTIAHFKLELVIVKSMFELPETNVIIRLHPGKHISEDYLNKTLSNKSFTISNNPDLLDDFALASVVISTVFSTIFYDAVVFGLPVIRICQPMAREDFSGEFEGLYDVSNSHEFNGICQEILSK